LFYPSSDFYDEAFLDIKKKQLKELFPQEYPETATEAFLASGEQYFNPTSLKWYLDNVKEKIEYEFSSI
jgi:hypothetical protein